MQRRLSAAAALALVLGAAVCFAQPARAQVVAGPGDDINVGNTVVAPPAGVVGLSASGGGRIYNLAGQPVTVTVSGAVGAQASTGSIINLDGGGQVNVINGGALTFGLFADGGTITSTADVTTQGTNLNYNQWGAAGAVAGYGGTPGTITLNAGTITTNDLTAYGIVAVYSGSIVTSYADVITTGNDSLGAHANFGTVNVNGGSITTSGTQAAPGGFGAAGLSAIQNGTINAGAVTVTTSGVGSPGLALSLGGTANLTGTNINTQADNTAGIWLTSVFGAGTHIVNGTGVTVTTQGAGSHGILISGAGGTNTLTFDAASTITTNGANAYGAYAEAGGAGTINGGQIITSGSAAHGLYSSGAGAAITAFGVDVAVSGAGAAGIFIENTGAMTVSNSTVGSALGNALLSTSLAGQTNTAQITRSILSSSDAPAMLVQGGTHIISLQQTQVTGNGTLLEVDADEVTLNAAASSVLFGDIDNSGGNIADVTLSDGTIWTGVALGVTNVALTNATWKVTGDSSITDTLTNGGNVAFAAKGAFKTPTQRELRRQRRHGRLQHAAR